MRASWLGPSSVVAVVCACSLGACSATNTTGFTGTTSGNGGASSGTEGVGGTQGNGDSTSTGINIDAGMVTSSGTGTSTMINAYAHTNTELFKLDPTAANLGLTQIGAFDCIGGTGQDSSMTDLAVNDTGDLWAVSSHNFYKLDLPATTGTVHCASTTALASASGVSFYGLTFAPVGTINNTAEVLVASNTAGELYAIDTSNGALTQHGTFGLVPANDGHGHTYSSKNVGKAWELSGDIVFLANNGSALGFATVRDCPNPPSSTGCNTTDTLIEIDTTLLATVGAQVVTKSVRGQVVKSSTCTDTASGYGSMYGIAAYGSNVYGFSHEGSIVEINNNDGTACLVLSTPSDTWAGAAISTLAPVVPPPTN